MLQRWTAIRPKLRYGLATAALGASVAAGVALENDNASELHLLRRYLAAKRENYHASLNDEEKALDGTWLMKATPSFPHVVVVSPQDHATTVTSMLLRGGIEVPLGDVVSFSSSLRSPPIESVRSLWVRFLRKVRACQFYLESGLRSDLYDARLLQYELDLLTQALQQESRADDDDALVYILAPREALTECSTDRRALYQTWGQALTSQQLAHVVWTAPTCAAITEFVVAKRESSDICLLVRPQSACVDASSAEEKLAMLAAHYDLVLSPDDVDRITALVGNWWTDLEDICASVAASRTDDDMSVIVDDVCTVFEATLVAALKTYLRLPDDVASCAALGRTAQIELLEKWHAFEAACGLSNESAQVLANAQALIKPKGSSPLPDVRLVLAAFAASGVTGERRFWDLFASNWVQLEPNSAVAVGVVPCDAIDILRGCSVVVRPLLLRHFRALWSDDATWTAVQDLQHALDAQELRDNVLNYESEVEMATRLFHKKRAEYELAWSAFDDAEKAQYAAELYLQELRLQTQREHIQRLKTVYGVPA
ncbi:hypothetical protein, variant [Saprolegnia diclina VS20]|uniref:Uncharacterized protein n=1 Tax=Saprolegnia diclina (strain VS20) TaxID=1156394 RepID=T0QKR9_SAPDV|nr:hypothetical protein, variant [Saprolegnia diclina VS20]EQC38639.1 hypothetical protein, variant [Saprolegnia diclina VS20]|eukprot:XP_008608231.1 hypothetical protein, variant [Saprolegnia diclina VS20]